MKLGCPVDDSEIEKRRNELMNRFQETPLDVAKTTTKRSKKRGTRAGTGTRTRDNGNVVDGNV